MKKVHGLRPSGEGKKAVVTPAALPEKEESDADNDGLDSDDGSGNGEHQDSDNKGGANDVPSPAQQTTDATTLASTEADRASTPDATGWDEVPAVTPSM